MRRLIRVRRDEQGAIAVIVALFMFFVVLGLGALTIDVGNINANRRQLQNGADAVALAVAQQCADNGTCTPTDSSLQSLANDNAPRAADGQPGMMDIRRVDGSPAVCGSGPGLSACPVAQTPADLKNLQECPSPSDPTSNYVRVYTETTNAAGKNILPYAFGAAITGVGPGANQQACASAAWGSIGTYNASVPITISLCMFDAMAGGASNLPAEPSGAWPGYGPGHVTPWPSLSTEKAEYTTKYAGTCPNSNGHTANGSFGWLTNNACLTSVTTGDWVNGDPGNSEKCAMAPYWGTKILVPIFDCVVDSKSQPVGAPGSSCSIPSGGGSNIWYHIAGWASFYLSGYSFTSDSNNSVLSGIAPCSTSAITTVSSSASCMVGWLTKLTLSTAPLGTGTGYGVQTVKLVG